MWPAARDTRPGPAVAPEALMNETLTRRGFACGLASALGACVVAPGLAGASARSTAPAAARPHSGLPPGTVRIDSNENPYGPSPRALEAMSDSQKIAARYPDALE